MQDKPTAWRMPLDLALELSRYASHPTGCAIYGSYANGPPDCSCGYDELLIELGEQRRFDAALRAKLQEPIFLEMRSDVPPNYRTPTEIAAHCVWAGEPSPGATIPATAPEPQSIHQEPNDGRS